MSVIPGRADVVVIGGGPAGSTAANLLARQDYEVVLLDKARHPRIVVGESILPHIWRYLDLTGATPDIERAAFIKKSGGTGVWRGGIRQMAMKDFGFTRPSLHVDRDEFDHILLRVAERQGVRVFEQVAVRSVELGADERALAYTDRRAGGEVQGRIRCRYIVDASGQAAIIANQLGFREFDRDLRFTSVWGYYENSSYCGQGGTIYPWEMRREAAPTTMQMGTGGADEWGWLWHIVQKEHTSVGLVLSPAQGAEFKALGATLEERLDRACRKLPIVSELLAPARLIPGSGLAIRDFAYRPVKLAGEGWFLAGDAAAFVDPINSAGVVTAFYTGFAAASAVDQSLRKPERHAYFASVFAELARQRLALFRLSALPAGHNSYPEDIPVALKAAQLDRHGEQELLLTQTILTDRRENLAPLYALDHALKYHETAQFRRYERLRPYQSAVRAAAN